MSCRCREIEERLQPFEGSPVSTVLDEDEVYDGADVALRENNRYGFNNTEESVGLVWWDAVGKVFKECVHRHHAQIGLRWSSTLEGLRGENPYGSDGEEPGVRVPQRRHSRQELLHGKPGEK